MKKYYYFLQVGLLSLCCIAYINSIAQKKESVAIDSLLNELQTSKTDTGKVNTLNALAFEYKANNPDTALVFCKEALQISEKTNWQTGIGKSSHTAAVINYESGNYDSALAFYLKELNVWELMEKDDQANANLSVKVKRAKALQNIGMMHEIKSDYGEALTYLFKGLNAFEELKMKDEMAQALVNIGIVYSEGGQYSKSIENYFNALKIFEASANKIAMAKTYGNIGIVYEAQAEYEKALSFQFKALKISEELNDQDGIASDLTNIAMIYSSQKKPANSLEYYSKALKITEESGNKYLGAIIVNNMGEVYDKIKEYQKAEDYYSKALKTFTELKFKSGIATAIGNLGYLFFEMKQNAKAEKYMLQSLSIYDSLGTLNEIMKANTNLSEFYSGVNNYKKALDHYKKARVASDSLFNQAQIRQINSKVMQYEFDNKELAAKAEQDKKDAIAKDALQKQKLTRNAIALGAGIIILSSLIIFLFYKRKRDAIQKQKEADLNLKVSETEMKVLRSQMNPHFIFNALHSIKTFLNTHQPGEAQMYLLKFAQLMRAVLENSEYSEVSLRKEKESLELYMALESLRLTHPFTYRFYADEAVDMEEAVIPPLLLQPFVENAIWHGLQQKPMPGHIDIDIVEKNDTLCITIKDDGIGRQISNKDRKYPLVKKESMGMKLVEERLKILNESKKIKAYFTISDLFTEDNQPAGTKVELFLPLTE